MNTRLTTLCLTGFLALTSFVARPLLADEWNKRTEFQFSAPVQIPGHTLAAGKYVFQLADSDSDRNVVLIFSEDSTGRQNLVTTLMAVPDYLDETPDNLWSILKSGPPGHPKRFTVGSTPARTRGGSSSTPTPRRREINEMSSDSARDGTTPRHAGTGSGRRAHRPHRGSFRQAAS